jgi:hypothetical protein
MKTEPRVTPSSARAVSAISPRREATVMTSPPCAPSASRSSGCIDTTARGSIASSTEARRVIEPVCQCSSCRR